MKSTKSANKQTIYTYVVFRSIAIFMLFNQLIMQRWSNVVILLLTLVLLEIPAYIENKFKIKIPSLLEIIIISFIFSSTILGELSDFYGYFKIWDTALHTINGFLAAGVGFSLVYLLNRNVEGMNLTPLFLALVTFCFSMTVGVMWEFLEFSADMWLNLDMQKDFIVQRINSVNLGEINNTVHQIDNIKRTIIESVNDSGYVTETIVYGGYLDVGIIDTMKDLFVNLIGAVTFSILSYLYSKNDKEKYLFIQNFIAEKSE